MRLPNQGEVPRVMYLVSSCIGIRAGLVVEYAGVGAARSTHKPRLARKRHYPIIRFLANAFYTLAVIALLAGLGCSAYLWLSAESENAGRPFAAALSRYRPADLLAGAAVSAGAGLLCFLVLGAVGQFLAMQRDRAINSANQVRLLEDILELNEELGMATKTKRVELCEGCGRLGSLHRIESGQWVCRECRRQLRSTA
jgi:hypothetical protein